MLQLWQGRCVPRLFLDASLAPHPMNSPILHMWDALAKVCILCIESEKCPSGSCTDRRLILPSGADISRKINAEVFEAAQLEIAGSCALRMLTLALETVSSSS